LRIGEGGISAPRCDITGMGAKIILIAQCLNSRTIVKKNDGIKI
jgi:hypothetical protein